MIMLLGIVAAVVILLAFTGLAMARLYQKATPELAIVKTGSGKGKAIINGGTVVIPIFHEVMRVGMKTLKIEVSQSGENAFITKDHRRVDIDTEFYIRVKPDEDSVMTAAQTLGAATREPKALLPFVEGKLVGSLRTAAATMDLLELHEERDKFVESVQSSVAADLEQNGLELESAAVTSLDQTPLEHLRETNVFDAEGMRAIAEITNQKKEERSLLDESTRVKIADQEKEAELQVIEAARVTEEARIEKEQQIAEKDAAAEAAVRKAQEESAREAEQARIAKERAVENDSIEKKRTIEEAEVARRKSVQLADYQAEQETAEASKAVSAKEAEAARAREEKVVAEEAVITSREKAEAERQKIVDVISAEKEAEVNAAAIRITAEVEKQAEEDRAEARRIMAQAQSDADKLEAEGIIARGDAEATAEAALVDAKNKLAQNIIDFELGKVTVNRMPDIIREIAKPADNIDSITVLQGNGLGTVATSGDGSSRSDNIMEDLYSAMRRNHVAMPIIEKMVNGLKPTDGDVSETIKGFMDIVGDLGNGHDIEGEASIIKDDFDDFSGQPSA